MAVSSVSRRLLLSISVPLVLFFGVTIAALDATFRQLTEQALREELQAKVDALIPASDADGSGRITPQLESDSQLANPGSGFYAQIRDAQGTQFWRSPSAAGTLIDFGPVMQPGQREFAYVDNVRQGRLAVFRYGLRWEDTGHDVTFSVAKSMKAYSNQLTAFRTKLLGLFVVLTGALLGTLAVLMRRVLHPIRRLEQEVNEVEAATRERLGDDYPRELAGLALNLNALIERERARIRRYRDTLGNLAHSLKTPLAVMRASLPATPPDAARTLDAEIGRMSGIIEHQLKRAAASGGATVGQAPVPLAPIARDLRAALLKVHARKDLSITLAIGAECAFFGDRGDITEALGNLMENACKWSRSGVRVSAVLEPAVSAKPARPLRIVVEDDGPGIAEQDRERVLERGVRADEQVAGHGLGLAMVRDMVELYGGEVEIGQSALGGARVAIVVPGRAVDALRSIN
jgi:two-component system sensor histidine kinase PhoQ